MQVITETSSPEPRFPHWGPSSWLEGIALASLCFLLYALLQQDIFYGDGSFTLHARASGALLHQHHLLNHLLVAFGQVLASPFTSDLFDQMSFAMRLLVALGVLIAHRTALHLQLSLWERITFTGLVGLSGVSMFYATAIELQGAYFPFLALVFDRLLRCGRAPDARNAVLLGLATGTATLVHATGHLMFGLVVPWLVFAVERQRHVPFGQVVRCILITGLVHGALVGGVLLLHRVMTEGNPLQSQAEVLTRFARFDLSLLPFSLVREWLLPFVPGSVLLFMAVFMARQRPMAAAVLIAWIPYQTLTLLVLRDFDERGAYILPLVFPLALLVVRVIDRGRACQALALLIALGSGIALNREYASSLPDPPDRFEVDAITEQGSALLLFVGPWSGRPLLRHVPGLKRVDLAHLASSGLPPELLERQFDEVFASVLAAGHRVLIPASDLMVLRHNVLLPIQERFLQGHLLSRYRFDPSYVGGFRYAIVSPVRH